MTELLADQAAGLRRLLAPRMLRTVAVTSALPSAGRTLVAANLAVALASEGRNVLLVDCGKGPSSASELLGVRPRSDLLYAARGSAEWQSAVVEGAAGVRVAAASALAVALGGGAPPDPSRLAQLFDTLQNETDVLLVDAPPDDLVLAAAAGEAILLAGPEAEAATESYRLIKRLHADGGRARVHVVVNRTQTTAHGDRIFGNLSATSNRFLNLPLELLGQISDDERVPRAARLRQPVVEVFPDAVSASALRACAEALSRWPYPGDTNLGDFAIRLVETAGMLRSTGH